jgi:hypothetical protein
MVALPVPLVGEVTVIHALVFTIVQAHPALVVRVTDLFVAPVPWLRLEGERP